MEKNTAYFRILYIGINMKVIAMRTYIMLLTCFYFRAKYIENIEYGHCVIHSEQKVYITACLGHMARSILVPTYGIMAYLRLLFQSRQHLL